jgi:putative salt-induced outer membrane protein YdiY
MKSEIARSERRQAVVEAPEMALARGSSRPRSRVVRMRTILGAGLLAAALPAAFASSASAQSTAPTGTPPPDATALVAAPKDSVTAPTPDKPSSGTNVSLSAGGQLATGDSRLLAMTANGELDSRWGSDGIGASILGNYGESATPGNALVETTANVQGRIRYDRYLIDRLSLFLINTGRNDRFQGLDFRYNLDPGVKYLFFNASTNALWVEAGYDFQYDIRRDDARVQLDSTGAPIRGARLLAKTEVDHSLRLYAGFKHSFNEEVTLSTGVEYIQSFTDTSHRWLNYDLLFAAKIGAGLALGLGFNARYDSGPLPDKKNIDTATTLSLIYAFSNAAPPKPAPAPPPCPPPPPEAAPAPAPAPATIPGPDAPSTMSPPATAP